MATLPYDWVCHVCCTTNLAHTDTCATCGSPAILSGEEITRLRCRLDGCEVPPNPSNAVPQKDRPWWALDVIVWSLVAWFTR
jgi:hypothetical protein